MDHTDTELLHIARNALKGGLLGFLLFLVVGVIAILYGFEGLHGGLLAFTITVCAFLTGLGTSARITWSKN